MLDDDVPFGDSPSIPWSESDQGIDDLRLKTSVKSGRISELDLEANSDAVQAIVVIAKNNRHAARVVEKSVVEINAKLEGFFTEFAAQLDPYDTSRPLGRVQSALLKAQINLCELYGRKSSDMSAELDANRTLAVDEINHQAELQLARISAERDSFALTISDLKLASESFRRQREQLKLVKSEAEQALAQLKTARSKSWWYRLLRFASLERMPASVQQGPPSKR
jgi:hypothetical protein